MTQLRGCFSYSKPGGGSDAGVCRSKAWRVTVCVGLYNDSGGMMGWRDATLTPRSLAQAVSGCLAHPHIHSEVPCSNPLGRKIQAEGNETSRQTWRVAECSGQEKKCAELREGRQGRGSVWCTGWWRRMRAAWMQCPAQSGSRWKA